MTVIFYIGPLNLFFSGFLRGFVIQFTSFNQDYFCSYATEIAFDPRMAAVGVSVEASRG